MPGRPLPQRGGLPARGSRSCLQYLYGTRDDDDAAVIEPRRLFRWIIYCHRVFYRRLERLTRWFIPLASDLRVSDVEWLEACNLLFSFAFHGTETYKRATELCITEYVNVVEAQERGGAVARDEALSRLNQYWNGEYPPDCECQYCMYSRDVIVDSITRSWSSVSIHCRSQHLDRQSQHFHERELLERQLEALQIQMQTQFPRPYYMLRGRIRAAPNMPSPDFD